MSPLYLPDKVTLSAGTKKLFAATAFGAVSLIFLARRFRRRKGKKKASSPVEQEKFEFLTCIPLTKGNKHTKYLMFQHCLSYFSDVRVTAAIFLVYCPFVCMNG